MAINMSVSHSSAAVSYTGGKCQPENIQKRYATPGPGHFIFRKKINRKRKHPVCLFSKNILIPWIRIDLRAAHRYPLARWPEERIWPGGGRRQHTGPAGGLLLCLQSGPYIMAVQCVVSPQGGADDPMTRFDSRAERDAPPRLSPSNIWDGQTERRDGADYALFKARPHLPPHRPCDVPRSTT